MDKSIADIRVNYSQNTLSESAAHADAMEQFKVWWTDAVTSGITEVNAMNLATVDTNGTPDSRIVLLKDITEEGYSFFTNYDSVKGIQLANNPHVCLLFFWKELERQVRIFGIAAKLDESANEAYYYSRPVGSQIGAIASMQSAVIADRTVLENKQKEIIQAVEAGMPVVKPENWGGYLVKPNRIEFWQGGSNRLHDRLQYTLQENNSWKIERLAP